MAVIADLRAHRDLSLLFITHDLALAARDLRSGERDAARSHRRVARRVDDARRCDGSYTKLLMSASLDLVTPAPAQAADRTAEPLLRIHESPKELSGAWRNRGQGDAGRGRRSVDRGRAGGLARHRRRVGVGQVHDGTCAARARACRQRHGDRRAARTGAGRRAAARIDDTAPSSHRWSSRTRINRSIAGRRVRQCLNEAVRVHQRSGRRKPSTSRVRELMAQVRLDVELLDVRPRALSGGQRQRVAIARALAADPSLLVLDEAVSALDVTTRWRFSSLLDTIRHETGVTLLMITHDLTVIRRLCDHVVVMRAGRIEERGSAEEILDRPQTDYTRLLLDSIPREGWKPRRRRLGRTQSLPTVTGSSRIVSRPAPNEERPRWLPH